MTCADLNNFLTGVREKSWFAGGGVGGGEGRGCLLFVFFLLCEINEFELSRSRGPYPLQSHLSIRACKLLNRVYVSYKE